MPAALRQGLVLELDRGGAHALEQAHRALDVERVAETVVTVHDQRHLDPLADAGDGIGHLGERGEADIGPADAGEGDARTTHISATESGAFDEQRSQRVVAARGDECRAGQQFTQASGVRHQRALFAGAARRAFR